MHSVYGRIVPFREIGSFNIWQMPVSKVQRLVDCFSVM